MKHKGILVKVKSLACQHMTLQARGSYSDQLQKKHDLKMLQSMHTRMPLGRQHMANECELAKARDNKITT